MKMKTRHIYLASASPRRRELLSALGVEFDVMVSTCDEQTTETDPAKLCLELASQKAADVAERILKQKAAGLSAAGEAGQTAEAKQTAEADQAPDPEKEDVSEIVVIGADTVVAVEGQILGKPHGRDDLRRMLHLLSGREHQVYTGVCVHFLRSDGTREVRSFTDCTDVGVCELTEEEMEAYLDSKEPYDKAGGYAIQGIFGRYITYTRGDYHNVVGLPVGRLYRECLR